MKSCTQAAETKLVCCGKQPCCGCLCRSHYCHPKTAMCLCCGKAVERVAGAHGEGWASPFLTQSNFHYKDHTDFQAWHDPNKEKKEKKKKKNGEEDGEEQEQEEEEQGGDGAETNDAAAAVSTAPVAAPALVSSQPVLLMTCRVTVAPSSIVSSILDCATRFRCLNLCGIILTCSFPQ